MNVCPDENDILGLVHGWLDDADRSSVHAHLAECSACRILVAELARGLPAPADHEPERALPAGTPRSRAERGRTVASRYVLTTRLGRGAHGIVWAAEDIESHEEVAVKILGGVDSELAHRLRREARLAQTLHHPNVVSILGVYEDAGAPVLVMERLRGRTLRQRLEGGSPLVASALAHVVSGVIAGVSALHGVGVVHRDLKPENIFLVDANGSEPIVKILDFGLAKWSTASSARWSTLRTRTGHVLGTPAYMAPEQIFGMRDVDERADVWAIAAIVFECLTGTLPFGTREAGGVMRAASQRAATTLGSSRPDLGSTLVMLIDSALSREPAARPSMTTLEGTLPALLASSGT